MFFGDRTRYLQKYLYFCSVVEGQVIVWIEQSEVGYTFAQIDTASEESLGYIQEAGIFKVEFLKPGLFWLYERLSWLRQLVLLSQQRHFSVTGLVATVSESQIDPLKHVRRT